TTARDALGGRAAIAAGVVHVAEAGHVVCIGERRARELRARDQRRRGGVGPRTAAPRLSARLISEYEHAPGNLVLIFWGRRRKGRSGRDPYALAVAPAANLAEGGVGHLPTKLLRERALDVAARRDVGDADGERAHLVITGGLQRRAQLSAL